MAYPIIQNNNLFFVCFKIKSVKFMINFMQNCYFYSVNQKKFFNGFETMLSSLSKFTLSNLKKPKNNSKIQLSLPLLSNLIWNVYRFIINYNINKL